MDTGKLKTEKKRQQESQTITEDFSVLIISSLYLFKISFSVSYIALGTKGCLKNVVGKDLTVK